MSVMHITARHTKGSYCLPAAPGGTNVVRGTAAVLMIALNRNCWVADWRCGAWQEGSTSNRMLSAVTAGLTAGGFGSHEKCVQSVNELVKHAGAHMPSTPL